MFDLIFCNPAQSFGPLIDPLAARAVPEKEIAEMQIQQAGAMANAAPSLYRMMMMQNYRPPVHVPEGWADWYAIGDGAI